jgi:hypothetical protein
LELGLEEAQWQRALSCLLPGKAVILAADPVVVRTPFRLFPARFAPECEAASVDQTAPWETDAGAAP